MTGSGFSRSAITRSTLCLSIATALALPVAIPAITPSTAVEQTAEKRDSAFYNGTTSERAAASCWEAKQANPEAKSGAYWLYTPAMSQPAQFYCDQETDGGGWVKIGEGRDLPALQRCRPRIVRFDSRAGQASELPARRKDPDSAFGYHYFSAAQRHPPRSAVRWLPFPSRCKHFWR